VSASTCEVVPQSTQTLPLTIKDRFLLTRLPWIDRIGGLVPNRLPMEPGVPSLRADYGQCLLLMNRHRVPQTF
jgi:hypothetical protein